jgi:glutathione synthase/RimK-type ligase-like ATP-grasp enzyme
MKAIIFRRRALGKASADGIIAAATKQIAQVRNWIRGDWESVTTDDDTPLVFRWGCTSNIPIHAKVVNAAKAIHWCGNKKQSRLDMQAAGVPVPFTLVCGDTVPHEYRNNHWIARPPTHSQGRNLFVGSFSACKHWLLDNFGDGYIAVKVAKVAEYRVFVCQNRVVWVASKTPANPDEVAWNVARGGKFANVRWNLWPIKVIKAAIKAAKVGGADFCGVDVMVDANGNPYVLEANSAPSQTSPYRQSCTAKAFDYIIENGKEPFNDVHGRTYMDYIHPAVIN